jgi:hypothetical protein
MMESSEADISEGRLHSHEDAAGLVAKKTK